MKYTQNKLIDFFEFLDELRESGVTNMYGAGPYLRREFNLTRDESHEICGLWMHEPLDVPIDERVAAALAKVRP